VKGINSLPEPTLAGVLVRLDSQGDIALYHDMTGELQLASCLPHSNLNEPRCLEAGVIGNETEEGNEEDRNRGRCRLAIDSGLLL